MSEQVEVTMQALLDASGGLDAVIDEMSTLGADGVEDVGNDPAAYGHDRLAEGVRGFAEAWSYGLSVLMRDATGLSEALSASAQTYAETENINIDTFQSGR